MAESQTPAAPHQPPQATPQPNNPLRQIRTFQGDIAQALESQHESLYSIQAKERARAQQLPGTKVEKSILFFLGGLLLIVLTGVAAWYTYTEFLNKTAPPVVALPANRFISAEKSVDVNVQGMASDALFEAITAVAPANLGQLEHLVLRTGTSTLLTTEAFFTAINSSAPSSLVRAFGPYFMLGSSGDDYFLIFKVHSYPNAFAGMLQWEPNMFQDLAPLFTRALPPSGSGVASVFKDIVSKNKDVRALYDASGTAPVLLYSFFGQEYLVVTDNLNTLQALLDRLTQNMLSR